jgi:hypothetical protein
VNICCRFYALYTHNTYSTGTNFTASTFGNATKLVNLYTASSCHLLFMLISWYSISIPVTNRTLQICFRVPCWTWKPPTLSSASRSRNSSVSIVTRLLAGWSGFDFRQGQGFFFRHSVQNDSRAYPAFHPMCNMGSLPGGKTAGAWNWPLASILWVQVHLRSPIRLHGVVLS